MTTRAAEGAVVRRASIEDKYLTFELHGTVYGIGITKVREIIGMMDMTRVPMTPDFIRGVMNMRGRIVAAVDLRAILGMAPPPDTIKTKIIIYDAGCGETGLIVDRVREVMTLPPENIEDAPDFGCEIDTEFISGMGKSAEGVTLLLDFEKALQVQVPGPRGGSASAPQHASDDEASDSGRTDR